MDTTEARLMLRGIESERKELVDQITALDEKAKTLRGVAMTGPARTRKAKTAGAGKRLATPEQREKQSIAAKERWRKRKEAEAAKAPQGEAVQA